MTKFVGAIWIAYLAWGVLYAVMAPMWDGFDEPFHLAYVEFVASHGRPPGFEEPSLPGYYLSVNRQLPSMVGYGAPAFADWRAMAEAERRARRAAAGMPSGPDERVRYAGENYERQQGPLFYFMAAPVRILFRDAALPVVVVMMRIFCVLLSSAVIPLSALLIARTVSREAVYVGAPLVALLPNTASYAFRISNEALVWPLFALAMLLLVMIVQSPTRRRLVSAGIVLVLGIYTKLTLAPLVPVAFLVLVLARKELRRAGLVGTALLTLVALPLGGVAILFWWNWAASGSFTGLVEAAGAAGATPVEYLRALFAPRLLEVIPPLLRNHFWAGGWGFVQPARHVYSLVFAVIGAVGVYLLFRVVSRGSSCVSPAKQLILPGAVVLMFALAMLWHIASFTVAAQHDARFAGIGAEGWYFDAIRPVQAVIVAWLWCAAGLVTSRVVIAHLAVLGLVDFGLTFGVMAPRWSGGELRGMADLVLAAPLRMPPVVVTALAILFIASILTAAALASRPFQPTTSVSR